MAAQLSASTIRLIRMGAILVWVLLAVVSVYYAWAGGTKAAFVSGEDLSLITIREKAERRRNLENPPELDLRDPNSITVPDASEMRRDRPSRVPYPREKSVKNELEPEDSRLKKPYEPGRENRLPPYRGESDSDGPYPRRRYIPGKDSGVGDRGERTGPASKENRTRERTEDKKRERAPSPRVKKGKRSSFYPSRREKSPGFVPPR